MHPPRRFCFVLVAAGMMLLDVGPWESAALGQRRADLRHRPSRLAGAGIASDESSLSVYPRLAINDPIVEQSQESLSDDDMSVLPNGLPPPPTLDERVRFTTAWIPDDDLGFTDFELWAKWMIPTFTPYHQLTLKPGYGLHFVDGPMAPDLPARLHDLYFDVGWLLPFSPEYAIEVGVTPGLYTDFEQGTSDAFRFGARAIFIYTASEQWRFVLGGAYLDRDDVDFLPIVGAIWTPNPDTKLQLVFPQPKFARRIGCCNGVEDWLYITGEFGGGSWAVERTTGALDVANYRDWRVSVGWEQKAESGPSFRLEAGYVFNRRLEFRSGGAVFEPGDSFIIQASIGF